jgi:CHAD domain-containing protein
MKSAARHSKPAVALREVLARDVRAAIEKLNAARDVDVHAIRKDVKHARAIVRLLRYGLPGVTYQAINHGLRDSARSLSRTRDTEVLIATIAGLEQKYRLTTLRPLQDALVNEQRRRNARSAGRQIALAKRRLETLSQIIGQIDIATTNWPAILRAIGETYRRARKNARRAQSEPTSDNLHDWRKQVKYLWHQVRALTPLAPRRLQRMARGLHRLADHLGDHHDLSVLDARLASSTQIAEEDCKDLQALINRRRARLERKAFDLSERWIADKRKKFERKLEAKVRINSKPAA